MNSNEFSPYYYLSRTVNLWWVVCVSMLVGGTLGFAFFQLHRPVYEATATYMVTIDLSRFPLQGIQADLVQYNEDLAVNTTQGVLLSDAVVNEVSQQLNANGMQMSAGQLLQNYTIERKHELWELRYRSPAPGDAQTVVNAWAQIGYQAMLSWQARGLVPAFVIFQPPSHALLPARAVLYGRNNLMLAGAMVGLIVGIVISAQLGHLPQNSTQGF